MRPVRLSIWMNYLDGDENFFGLGNKNGTHSDRSSDDFWNFRLNFENQLADPN